MRIDIAQLNGRRATAVRLWAVLVAAIWLAAQAPAAAAAAAAGASSDDGWIAKIRPDHPRLFFNRATWPRVRERALGPEKARYDQLKRRVDAYPDNPTSESTTASPAFRPRPDGGHDQVELPKPREWGVPAVETAFLYLMTGERRYLDKARRMLEVSVAAYNDCYRKGMTVNWYSTSRVCALAAYDWICSDLAPEQRRAILLPFLRHIDDVQPGRGKPRIYRLNASDHTTGFYGDTNLLWFAGLAAFGDGIDDATALRFLRRGYQYNQDLFAYRRDCAGDDGGLASATVGYALGAYPWAQFNFLHTWKSATGEEIAADWPHLAYFPVWIMWNWLPGPVPLEFGSGDTYHYTNALPIAQIYSHMSEILHFYGRSQPDCAALAAHLRARLPDGARRFSGAWPIQSFLLTEVDSAPPARAPQDADVRARRFEALGQVFMRSGAGPDDTYALFTIGSRVPSHKQHDENSFVIYKKGFLALDSGTRGSETDTQLRHYYSQTVAHNALLIHMPNEPFPGYWGLASDEPEGRASCGGTFKTTGGRCVAFETNPHYTYVAGDATPCYRLEKCRLALRQFVFVMPNHFVVCDRAVSTDLAFRKDWLLHTQNEPRVEGMQFMADEGDGRLFCRTFLPRQAEFRKIGGPGKEFWACGKNWELAPAVAARWKDKALFGNWRMEISPAKPAAEDVFLHLIEVGDKDLRAMSPAELIESEGAVGVRFRAGEKTATVMFATKGDAAGQIRIEAGGRPVIEQDLARGVMPQAGLAAK